MLKKNLIPLVILSLTISAVPVLAETYDDNPPNYFTSQGQTFYQSGQYSSAIKSFRTALREDSNDTSAKIGLINAYISRAKYYNDTEKSPKKALSDIKSALFYFVCFNGTSAKSHYSEAYASAVSNLTALEQSLKCDITGEGLVKSGKNLRYQGEFAAAGYDFYRALEDPVNAKYANNGLGDVLKILGQPYQAVKYYEKAVELEPNDAELRLSLARAYEESGQADLAAAQYNFALSASNEKEEVLNSLERICRQRVDKNPSDAEAHCNLGTIYQKRGNTEWALAEYQKAEKLNPALVISKVNTAILYYDQRKYKESIDFCNKALLIDPKNVQARLQKAKSFQALSMWENATEEYKNVLKYDAQNSEAQFGLAEIYSKNMPTEDALSTLKAQGISLSPEFYAQTAYTAHKNKDIEKAIKYYKLAIEANPNDKTLYLNLGQIYNGRNDFANASAYAELALQKFPNDEQVKEFSKSVKSRYSNSMYAEAEKLTENKQYSEALAKYQKISPQGYNSYIGIAGVYLLMNDYTKALDFYKKALAEKPDDNEILLTMAGIYIQQDDLTNAETYLKKITNKQNAKYKELENYINSKKAETDLKAAVEKYENHDYRAAETLLTGLIKKNLGGYMPYYYRAMVYDALGDFKLAVADYEKVTAIDSSIALVYYSLGVDYDSLKDFPRAVKNYKKYLELTNETNEYTKYARQRIQQSK
ncbi:MAG: tetratricopeptide repeat protein [Candidatus Gastranaerophilales bacterium]|nr:tetratricopeptide repeat protein [Candidatus Gastranaerophilales bacterium]